MEGWTFSCNARMDKSFARSFRPAPLKKLARGHIQRFVGPKPAIRCLICVSRQLHPPVVAIIVPAGGCQLAQRGVVVPDKRAAGIMQVGHAAIRITIVVSLRPATAPRDLVAFPDHLARAVVS